MLQLGTALVQRQGFGFGGGDFGAHARHVKLGHIALPEAHFGQAQGVAVGRQRVTHQGAFGVQRAQIQVGLRHIGLHQQPRAAQQRFAGLRIQRRGIRRARELAEQVDFIGQVGAHADHGLRNVAGREVFLAHGPRTQAQLHGAVGIGGARNRAGLRQPAGGDLHAVVAAAGLFDQLVQYRVSKNRPPAALRLRFG